MLWHTQDAHEHSENDVKAVRDYFDRKGLSQELWPQIKVSKKSNGTEEGGNINKGKGKEKAIK